MGGLRRQHNMAPGDGASAAALYAQLPAEIPTASTTLGLETIHPRRDASIKRCQRFRFA